LLTAALDGKTSAAKVDQALKETAIGRLVAEERRGLEQRIEAPLLQEFGKRLEQSGADAVIDARPIAAPAVVTNGAFARPQVTGSELG
jgi:hypothetical protein